MNFGKIKKLTFALTLALSFVCAPGLSSLSTVQAQRPQDHKLTPTERAAFRLGHRIGREDARAGRRFNYNKSSYYRRGDRYIRDDFRRGYTQGYRRG
jgi:hypothetical protein